MTRQEQNEALARWLGWKEIKQKPNYWIGTKSIGISPAGMVEPIPDFFISESASAMLLEKMPWPRLEYYADARLWACIPDANKFDKQSRGGRFHKVRTPSSEDPDRKTAIALAALAMIEREK